MRHLLAGVVVALLIGICSLVAPATVQPPRRAPEARPPTSLPKKRDTPSGTVTLSQHTYPHPTAAAPPVTPPAHDGFWCECTIGPLDGSRSWLVAGYRAPTALHALRRLTRQARRLAEQIDPDPVDAFWAPVTLCRPLTEDQSTASAPDPATALRRWPRDTAEHDQALKALHDGMLYTFTTADATLRYRLSARPVLTGIRQERAAA